MENSTKVIIGIGIVILIGLIIWLVVGMSKTPTGTSAGNTTAKASTGTSTVTDFISQAGSVFSGTKDTTTDASTKEGFLGYAQDGRPLFKQLGDTPEMVYTGN